MTPLTIFGLIHPEILMRLFFFLWLTAISASILMLTLAVYLWKKILDIGMKQKNVV